VLQPVRYGSVGDLEMSSDREDGSKKIGLVGWRLHKDVCAMSIVRSCRLAMRLLNYE